MWYQSPNGKTIWIDIEDAIELTDDDIQFLISQDYGEVIHNPFSKSSIEQRKISYDIDPENEEEEENNNLEDYDSYSTDVGIDDLLD